MLFRFRIRSLALIVGAFILGTGVTETRADVIYSTFGQKDVFDTVVGFSYSALADESAPVPLYSTADSDLASVKVAASDLTGYSVQLAIHSDLLHFSSMNFDAIIPVIIQSDSANHTNNANLKSHYTVVGLSLLAESVHLLATTPNDRSDNFFKLKKGDVGSTFSGNTDNTFIVAIVHSAYRIYAILVSDSSPLADPGNLILLSFGLVGLGYIGRRWNTYP